MDEQKHKLFTDGGARGNPGPAAIGGVLYGPDGAVLYEFAQVIGTNTNNQAEYRALAEWLRQARSFAAQVLDCYLDSELVVKQIGGQYKVKEPDLKTLHAEVVSQLGSFLEINFHHVPRAKNRHADRLVNEALDGKR
jgi:ribonuclease HI